MNMLKSQKGFSVFEVILVILVMVSLGAAGYFAYQARQESTASTVDTSESHKKSVNKLFQNSELGLSLTYPTSWGGAVLAQGEVVSPGKGNYKQLTFTRQKDVDINFVMDGFGSPLDGCPDPLTVAKHDLSSIRASVIGWDTSNVKRYAVDYHTTPQVYKVHLSSMKLDENNWGSGWHKISAQENLLVYRDINQAPYKMSSGEESCQEISQAEADEANKYYKYIHYALNFKNSKVKGVNAQYDVNKGEDAALRDALAKVLLSVK